MHPRYFITNHRLVAGSPEVSTFAFGRFESTEQAEAVARSQYGQYGSTVLAVRQETKSEAIAYVAGRFVIRTLRLVFGASVALAAYIFLWGPNPRLGTVPFGQMTLDMLLGGLVRGAMLLVAAWLAWYSAFGEGPDAKYK